MQQRQHTGQAVPQPGDDVVLQQLQAQQAANHVEGPTSKSPQEQQGTESDGGLETYKVHLRAHPGESYQTT